MRIRLNGEAYELPGPLTVTELLAHLAIDSRRIAIELNLTVLKRAMFDAVVVNEGDEVEIVNFVGGGTPITTDGPQRHWKGLRAAAAERGVSSAGRSSADAA